MTYCVYIDNVMCEDGTDVDLEDALDLVQDALEETPEAIARIEPFVESDDDDDEEEDT